MAYELVYYGNGPIMNDIIAAVNYVLNSPDYSGLLQLVLTLSGLFMIGGYHRSHLIGSRPGIRLLGSLLMVATLYYGAYAPKVDMVVYDPINHFNSSVRNVPIGTATIIWVSNKITNGFAELFDKGFTSAGFPDQFTYQNTGGTPSAILTVTTLGDVYPSTSYLLVSIENYLRDCWTVAAELGKVDYDTIYYSSNILQDMKVNLPTAWTTTYYDVSHPTGETLTCNDAYNAIVSAVESDASVSGGAMKNFADMLNQLGVAGINGAVDASNILQVAANYELNAGLTSQQLVAQAMMINALNPALAAFAGNSGLPVQSLSAALTESALQTTTTMSTSYALASVFLPMSFLVVQSFVIAVLPLIFALMFIPSLTRKYGLIAMDLFMWVAFWGPVASIINFIVQEYGRYSFQRGLGGVISFQKMPFLMSHGHTLMSVAGDLMFSVPVLAFALSSGSAYAMTMVAGGVSGLSKSAARSVSQKISTDEGAYSQMAGAQKMEETGELKKEGYLPSDTMLGSADYAAKHMAVMSRYMKRMSFPEAVKGDTLNMVQSTSHGLGLGNTANASESGMLQAQQEMGNVFGAYDAWKQSGSGQNFANWVAGQSMYRNTSAYQEAQAMQRMADRYFGGSLNNEMQYLKSIQAAQQVGGTIGEAEAYEMARRYGFKGSLTDFEAFQQKIHSASVFGQNVATVEAAKDVGRSVIGYTGTAREGSNVASYERGRAVLSDTRRFGTEALFGAENKRLAQYIGEGEALAPTPEQAREKGMWLGSVGYDTYAENRAAFGSSEQQALVERAKTVIGLYSPQIEAALATDSPAVTRSMNGQIANYLRTFGRVGAAYEASSVTGEEDKFIKTAAKSYLQTDRGRHMLGQLAAKVAAEAKVGTPFSGVIGDEFDVKGATQGELVQKIDNALKSGRGLEVAEDILRTALEQRNLNIAMSNPDKAFTEQKELFDNLRGAIKAGDVDKAAGLLGAGNVKQDLERQYHQGATPGRMINDVYHDSKETLTDYMEHLKKTLKHDLGFGEHRSGNTAFGVPVSEIAGKKDAGNDNSDTEKVLRESFNGNTGQAKQHHTSQKQTGQSEARSEGEKEEILKKEF